MSVRDTEEQERFLTDGLGLTRVAQEGAHIRFHINEGGAQKTVDLLHQPDVKQAAASPRASRTTLRSRS